MLNQSIKVQKKVCVYMSTCYSHSGSQFGRTVLDPDQDSQLSVNVERQRKNRDRQFVSKLSLPENASVEDLISIVNPRRHFSRPKCSSLLLLSSLQPPSS